MFDPAEPNKTSPELDVHELVETLGNVYLYVNWKHVTKQLTTPQKELFADAVDTYWGRMEPGQHEQVDRWWRTNTITGEQD